MTPVPEGFLESGGALYRAPNFTTPFRANWRYTHSEIRTVADLKATIRNGGFAWPGGYPLYFITADGGSLSFRTVRENFAECCRAIIDGDNSGGWRIIACEVNWEDDSLTCEHSGKRIESAYGDDDPEESGRSPETP